MLVSQYHTKELKRDAQMRRKRKFKSVTENSNKMSEIRKSVKKKQ